MTISGFKSLGDAGWVGFFSNIFPDLDIKPDAPDGERFTLAAHEEYTTWANSDTKNLPELWFGHLSNVKMGKATAVEVVGPFIVAVGQWGQDEIGQKAKAFFAASEDDWPMSHGFKYRVGDRVAGEYQRYRTHEVTVLPAGWEANPVTAFLEDSTMTQKGLRDELTKALQGLLGIPAEEAGKTVAAGMEEEKARKAKLVEGELAGQKDSAAAAAPAATTDAETADEPVGDDVLALALADALIAVNAGEEKRVALEGEVKALKTQLDMLTTTVTADLKALKDEAEARKSLLPKAVAQALQQRASEKGAEVPAEQVTEDAQKQADALKAKGPDASKDPLGWMAEQAGMHFGAPK